MVMAHSMGNRALTRALQQLAAQGGMLRDTTPHIFMFGAPDVATPDFVERRATCEPRNADFTLYCTSKDWALWASCAMRFFTRLRVGADEGCEGVQYDTIACTRRGGPVDGDPFFHGYVHKAKPVGRDVVRAMAGHTVNDRTYGPEGYVPNLTTLAANPDPEGNYSLLMWKEEEDWWQKWRAWQQHPAGERLQARRVRILEERCERLGVPVPEPLQ